MPAVTALKTGRSSLAGGHRRIVLKCDGSGACTLFSDPSRRFSDAEAALDYARRFNGAEMATIEVWQGDQYICCISQSARLRPELSVSNPAPAPNPPQHCLLEAAERYANRARFFLVPAGALFWLVLLFCVLAASLGWYIL